MYAAIRRYNVNEGAADRIVERVNAEFLPRLRQAPGFVSYFIIDGGDGTIASVTVFDDKRGADESSRLACPRDDAQQALARHQAHPGERGAEEPAQALGDLGAHAPRVETARHHARHLRQGLGVTPAPLRVRVEGGVAQRDRGLRGTTHIEVAWPLRLNHTGFLAFHFR